mmetsp:Transcript_70197/g.117122  ORF Transcript_70197/g.117122 Transcript_70197/m.117122 type:complete len:103 (+) Transcript_70197:130-438(+)
MARKRGIGALVSCNVVHALRQVWDLTMPMVIVPKGHRHPVITQKHRVVPTSNHSSVALSLWQRWYFALAQASRTSGESPAIIAQENDVVFTQGYCNITPPIW